MTSHYIISVGTSLITNPGSEFKWRYGDPLPDKDAVIRYLKQADANTASAETKSINLLQRQEQLTGSVLHWFHSATPEGRLCASALCQHFKDAFKLSGKLHEIEGVTYCADDVVERGLRYLVKQTFEVINEAGKDSSSVKICATGGFKYELAYLNLCGLLAQCPVCYAHERYDRLIYLPSLPVKWDHSLVEYNIEFFEWLNEDYRHWRDVENRLAPLDNKLKQLVDREDDFGMLSPAGMALYESYKMHAGIPDVTRWPADSGIEPSAKIKLSTDQHHRSSWVESAVNTIANIPCVSRITFGSEQPAGTRPVDVDVIDANTGKLKVTISKDGRCFSFIVDTTAADERQCQMLAKELKERLS